MTNKYLVLKGCAGLGNRLITLMKAIRYCEKNNRILYVDWADGMFGAVGDNAFYKYFDLKNIPFTTNLDTIKDLYTKGASTYPKKLLISDFDKPIRKSFDVLSPTLSLIPPYRVLMSFFFKEKFSYIAGLQSWQRIKYNKYKYLNSIKSICKDDNFAFGNVLTSKRKEDIVFFADFRPLVNINDFLSYISLKKNIQDKITAFAKQYNIKEAIGVHIRYTDKKPKAKLEKLKNKLDMIIKNNPNQKIFLCSDNSDIIKDFFERYGNNIFQKEKYLPNSGNLGIHRWAIRNSDTETKERMIIEGLMDMWLLSMTKVLYWQGNSSFSYISKIIKNDKKNTHNWMGILR